MGSLKSSGDGIWKCCGVGFPTIPMPVTTCSKVCWRHVSPTFLPETFFGRGLWPLDHCPRSPNSSWANGNWIFIGIQKVAGAIPAGGRVLEPLTGLQMIPLLQMGRVFVISPLRRRINATAKNPRTLLQMKHSTDASKATALVNTMESGGSADLEFAINNVK